MIRTHTIAHFLLAAMLAAPAMADGARDLPVVPPVIARLEAQDCAVTEVRMSWLRRIVVTCETATRLREVVVNRSSGAVLSDRTFDLPDDGHNGGPDSPAGSGNGAGKGQPDPGENGQNGHNGSSDNGRG